MSGTLGRVEEFDGSKDDWPQYIERMEYFLKIIVSTPRRRSERFSCQLLGQPRTRHYGISCLQSSPATSRIRPAGGHAGEAF